MNKLQKGLCIGTLVLSFLSGCENKPATLGGEYSPKANIEESSQAEISLEKYQTIEGKIADIQRSFFTFNERDIDSYSFNTTPHEFLYVKVTDKQNKNHILIYPKSEFIETGNAIITFRSFPKGYVNVKTLVDLIITPSYGTTDNFAVNAEGMIRGINDGGIVYKE